MNTKYSVGKKLCALILCALMIVGAMPMSSAVGVSDNTQSAESGQSTPDETPGDGGNTGTEDATSATEPESYPYFSFGKSELYSKENGENKVYVSNAEAVTEATVKFIVNKTVGFTDGTTLSLAEEIGKAESINGLFKAALTETGKEAVYEPEITSSSYNSDKKVLTLDLGFSNINSNGLNAADYALSIYYNGETVQDESLYEMSFCVCSAPKIENIKYNGKDTTTATNDEAVPVSFSVVSPIPKSIEVSSGDTVKSIELKDDNQYSFKATKSGKYTIKVTDYFERTDSIETDEIKIDTDAPKIKLEGFYGKVGKLEDWYNSEVEPTAKLTITDEGLGVNDKSIEVVNADGNTCDFIKETDENGSVTVSFKIDGKKNYTVSCNDNVGNEAEDYVISKDIINYDNDAPVDSDFTLTFEKDESGAEKVLNILTFGLYENKDIKVTVVVNSNGLSEIDSVKLYNGEEELAPSGNSNEFILSADEGTEKRFDLKVEAQDKAGNNSGKISVTDKDSKVKTQLSNNSAITLKNLNGELFEIVVSKLAPSFTKPEFSGFVSNNATNVIGKGEGTISVAAKVDVAGVENITARFKNGEVNEADIDMTLITDENDIFDPKNAASKQGSLTASVNVDAEKLELEEGVHTIVFTATSNSGVTSDCEVTFEVDKTAPELTGDNAFTYTNSVDGTQKWTKDDVTVSFNVGDKTAVSSVSYRHNDSEPVKITPDENGLYSFIADSYGIYTVTVTDTLGNSNTFTTDEVLIDKTAPEVVETDGKKFVFNENWTNEDVTVEFSVKDNPLNCSDIKSVKASRLDSENNSTSVVVNLNKETGKCSFIADTYGTYTVKITDEANNESSYELGPVQIDKTAPEITGVNFTDAKNSKSYGKYNNAALTMTVTVENPLNDFKVSSKLTDVEIRENGKVLANEMVDNGDGTYSVSYVINTDNNIHGFTFYAKDEAGNSVIKKLGAEGMMVDIDPAVKDNALYEVVVTEAKPTVDDIKIEFTNSKGKVNYNGKAVYSGDGTFTTKITDTLSGTGIDKYCAYLIKTDNAFEQGENGELKSVEKLNEYFEGSFDEDNEFVIPITGVSDDKKVTSADVEFNTKENTASGEYTVIVAAYNLSGNVLVTFENIVIDNTAPQVDSFDITTSGGDNDTVGDSGVYSANSIDITVNYSDGGYSGGIEKVVLYNGEDEIGEITDCALDEDNKGFVTFTLSKNGSYQLSALAVDEFGNELSDKQDIRSKSVTVNKNQTLSLAENTPFEIVVNSEDITGFTAYSYDFGYKTDSMIFKNIVGIDSDGRISTAIENKLSGIKTVEVTVKNVGTGETVVNSLTEQNIETDIFGKKVKTTAVTDVSSLESGKYVITYTAYDLCNNMHTTNETFYVDKTAPKIESINYEKNDSLSDKVLNLLTFGLYSNDSIKATVTVTDASPSSGINSEDIKLSSNKGLTVVENGFTGESSASAEQDRTYTKTFILKASEEAEGSFYDDLEVSVKDTFDNDINGGFRNYNNTVGETLIENADSDFEIVSSTKAPTVSEIKADGDNEYQRDDSTVWYSSNPELSFNVTDDISKIHSIRVELNDEDVTQKCTYNGIDGAVNNLPAEFTSFAAGLNNTEFSKKISSVDVVLDTSDLNLNQGESIGNTIKVTATGNNGVDSATQTLTFYYDPTAPTISNTSFENNADKVWHNTDIDVSFDASDNSGSGLNTLKVYRDNTKLDDNAHSVTMTADGKCSFTAKEYGYYTAKLTDKVNNEVTYNLGNILIDKNNPEISSVKLELADDSKDKTQNSKKYGTYANGTLKMTVTVDNLDGGYKDCSSLSDTAVTAENGNGNIKFIGRNAGTDEYVFEISPVNDRAVTNSDLNITLTVKDIAGNTVVRKLADDCVTVEASEVLSEYEVVASLLTPVISDIDISFKDADGKVVEPLENGYIYTGDGTFTTTITDTLSGIDKYYTYLIKTDNAFEKGENGENGELKSVERLNEFFAGSYDKDNEFFSSVSGVSDGEKVTSVDNVEFKTNTVKTVASGEYTAIVAAYNLSGNRYVTYKNIRVDNTAPEVDSFNITTSGGDKDTIGDGGVYSANSIDITVNYSDGGYSGGIARVELYDKISGETYTIDKCDLNGDNKGSVIFTLSSKGDDYQLSALVIDNFGNKLPTAQDIRSKSVTVNEDKKLNLTEDKYFEIVVNSKDETSFTPYSYDFEHNTAPIYKNGDGTISTEISNAMSGIDIDKIAVTVVKDGETTPIINKPSKTTFETDKFGKNIKAMVATDVSSLESGKYVITYTAYDLGGVEHSENDTFYIDKTAPKIENIKYEAFESAIDKALNLLTFGLYSKNSIKVTVTVTDAAPSSGISSDGIQLSSKTGKSVKTGEFKEETASTEEQGGKYTKTFILEASEETEGSFYSDLEVSVKDKYDNDINGGFRNYNNTVGDIPIENADSDFEIVSSTKAPTVSEKITVTGENEYHRESDSTVWYSNMPTLSFNVTDNTSKIHSIKVVLNGKDVTQECTYNGDEKLPAEFTHFAAQGDGTKISSADVVLDTKKVGLNFGENTVEVTARGNNGVNSETRTLTFYYDPDVPTISNMSFENDADKVWRNTDIDVSFDASDNSGSGVKTLDIYRDGIKLDDSEYSVTMTADGKCGFTAKKYGFYTAELTDEVNNSVTYDLGTVYIDKTNPEIASVLLELADDSKDKTQNSKKYGTYSNGTLKMTVTVDNPNGGYEDCSLLSDTAVTAENTNGNIKFIGRNAGTNEYVFEISPVNDRAVTNSDLNITLTVTDIAGNTVTNKLTDDCVAFDVSKELKEYEVVASLLTPEINDIDISFTGADGKTVEPLENGYIYSGDGTFKTTITDSLSGIDSYCYGFVRTSSVKFDENNNITNLDELGKVLDKNERFEVKTGVSDAKKETKQDITFESNSKGTLDSGEYTVIVAVDNLSGNRYVTYKNIRVDNTAPEVDSFNITTSGGDKDTIGDGGVYSANSIDITVNYSDGNYSGGTDKVILYNNNEALETKTTDSNSSGSVTFTLSNNGTYQLSALVVDKFGHQLAVVQDIRSSSVTVNGEQKLNLAVNKQFEIVVNAEDDTSFTAYDYDFGYKTDSMIFKNNVGIDSDGRISTTIENKLSGIKTVEVSVKKDGATTPVIKTLSETGIETDSFGKKIKTTTVTDVSSLDSGKYEITYTAYDLGGVKHSQTETFYIDKTAPKIENVKYEAFESAIDKALNLLTFGLYSNDSIKVTVTVTDAAPSAGISSDGIQLSSKTGKSVRTGEFKEEIASTEEQGGKYTKTFILEASKETEGSFYNDLSITVTDKFDNSQTDNKYEDYAEPTNIANDIDFDKTDGFDIVASSMAPTISEVKADGDDEYTRKSDSTLWFSANPTVSFSVTDNVSKIHSVEVKVNGQIVTNSCEYNGGTNLPTAFTTFNGSNSDQDTNIDSLNITLDTSAVKNIMKEGENIVTVNAVGNNGVKAQPKSITFYVDTEKPVVQIFDFADYQTKDGDNLPKADGVRNTDYGYFFQNKTVVTVTASDSIAIDGAGVRNIALYTQSVGEDKLVLRDIVTAVNNQASFVIEANFKGQLYAYADDFVNNNADGSSKFTPDSAIVETKAQHDANSSVTIDIPDTEYRDVNNKPLYAGNVNVNLTVQSAYAGIKTVEYTVTSAHDNNTNGGTSTVNKDGTVADWTVTKSDSNLATVLKKTITVTNNSNDIKVWVKVTDRAGFSTESEKVFSIDKTDPAIEVEYDVNNPNEITGESFYKTDRVMTVMITERNFNAKDFEPDIVNTEGGSTPQLEQVSKWSSYTPDSANPDATVHIAKYVFHEDGDYTVDMAFTDLVGRKAKSYGTDKFTVDQTAPKITISFDENNSTSYYNAKRTATITIEEHNFYEPYVDINQRATQADNTTVKTAPAVNGWNTSGDVSTATIIFDDDGMYSFTVDFKDKALNDAEQQEETEFYIDTKIDKIEIVGVEDSTAYDGTIAPQIQFFDNNYSTSNVTLERIDLNKDTSPVTNLAYSDAASEGFSRLVAYSDFSRDENNDGIYIMHASIEDRAGNTDEKEVMFSVNRFGSTFMLEDEASRELVEEKIYTNNAPDIVITEINVNEVKQPEVQVNRDDTTKTLKNGTDFKAVHTGGKTSWYEYNYTIFKKNFEDEGKYVITLTTTNHFNKTTTNRNAYKDAEDNENGIDRTCPVSFVVDKTPPIVTISGIESNQYYEDAAKNVTVVCDDANITAENLQIFFDNEEIKDYESVVSAGSVEVKLELKADGNTGDRSFRVNITDLAGNSNEDGTVTGFRLSATWFARLMHDHWVLVVAVCAAAVVLIGFIIFFVVKKRKKNDEK